MTYIDNHRLRPCDGCKGPLGPCFTVRVEHLAALDPERAQHHLGLAMMFGSGPGAEALANAMGPGACYRLEEESHIERFLCQQCTREVLT